MLKGLTMFPRILLSPGNHAQSLPPRLTAVYINNTSHSTSILLQHTPLLSFDSFLCPLRPTLGFQLLLKPTEASAIIYIIIQLEQHHSLQLSHLLIVSGQYIAAQTRLLKLSSGLLLHYSYFPLLEP